MVATCASNTKKSPLVHVVYFSAMNVLQGRGFDTCKEEVSAKFWGAMKVNWCVWPLAIFINVSYVPLPYRVLFVNCVGLGYGGFLSYAANDMQALATADAPPAPRSDVTSDGDSLKTSADAAAE